MMDTLQPINRLSAAAREVLAAVTMNREEQKRMCEEIAEEITYMKSLDMAIEILNNNKFGEGDTCAWIARTAYIKGVNKAIDAYSTVIEKMLRKRSDGNNG